MAIFPPPTPSLAALLAPLHLLSFSALLGAALYQSFLVTKISFSALPRPAFAGLQTRLFPAYFRAQALLLLLAAATVPPRGPLTLAARRDAWVPFAVAGAPALLNLVVYGPRTGRLMRERARREAHEGGAKPGDGTEEAGIGSLEMQQLKRSFSRSHAMSIHLNLISIGGMVWWGCKLASQLDFVVD